MLPQKPQPQRSAFRRLAGNREGVSPPSGGDPPVQSVSVPVAVEPPAPSQQPVVVASGRREHTHTTTRPQPGAMGGQGREEGAGGKGQSQQRARRCRRWTFVDDQMLTQIIRTHGPRNWKGISELMGGKFTADQCSVSCPLPLCVVLCFVGCCCCCSFVVSPSFFCGFLVGFHANVGLMGVDVQTSTGTESSTRPSSRGNSHRVSLSCKGVVSFVCGRLLSLSHTHTHTHTSHTSD